LVGALAAIAAKRKTSACFKEMERPE